MTALESPVRMSVDEFLAWDSGDGRTWQLVDGEPQAMSPATLTHGILLAAIGAVIGNHLHARDSAWWTVMMAGVIPQERAGINFRVADLAVTCTDYENEEFVVPDPVLIVEILSLNNQAETWANVWAYTTIPSVREILVLKTAAIEAEVLRRDCDGSWPREPERVAASELALKSIGLHGTLGEIYRSTWLTR